MEKLINEDLKNYVEENILPIYNRFDKGHDINHANEVIEGSILIAGYLKEDVNEDIVYTVAAYHDIGLQKNRENHHLESSKFVRNDKGLEQFFNDEEIEIIATAVSEHRASFDGTPESIYSKIVADADRVSSIEIKDMVKRSYDYNKDKHPEWGKQKRYQEVYKHLKEKFGSNGYAYNSIYLDETKKAFHHDIKESMRKLDEEEKFKEIYDELFPDEEISLVSEYRRLKLMRPINEFMTL